MASDLMVSAASGRPRGSLRVMDQHTETDQSRDPGACPGAGCFELLGRRWSAHIIWGLLGGPLRFTELLEVADGPGDRMLTKRLRELQEAGVVRRHRYREVPPRVEYSLTEAGWALRPVIEAMERWGRRWHDRRPD